MLASRRNFVMTLLAFVSVCLGGTRVGSAQGSGLNAPTVLPVDHWQQIGSGLVASQTKATDSGASERPAAFLVQDPWRGVRNHQVRESEPVPEDWRLKETIDPWAPRSVKAAGRRVELTATREIVDPWPARPRGTWATRREIIDPWAAPPR